MVKIYKNDFWEAHVEQKYPCTQKISLLAGKLTFYNPLKLNLSSVQWSVFLEERLFDENLVKRRHFKSRNRGVPFVLSSTVRMTPLHTALNLA